MAIQLALAADFHVTLDFSISFIRSRNAHAAPLCAKAAVYDITRRYAIHAICAYMFVTAYVYAARCRFYERRLLRVDATICLPLAGAFACYVMFIDA